MSRLGLLCVLLVASSCGRAALEATWVEAERLTPPAAERFPDAPALVLHRARRYLVGLEGQYGRLTQVSTHEVYAVRTEAGLSLADVKLYLPPKSRLVELRARMRRPDGTLEEVGRTHLLEQAPSGEGERSVNMKAFRFPDVRVGAVLEYVYTVEYEGVRDYVREAAQDELPVLRYEAQVDCHPKLTCTMTVYNGGSSTPRLEQVDGFWRMTWTAEGLAARPSEPWAPDWKWDHTWWAYRVKPAANTLEDVRGDVTWARELQWWARWAYVDGWLLEGFRPPAPAPAEGCQDAACRLERTLTWLRREVPFSGFDDSLSSRPLREVLTRRKADNFERALLLRKLLGDAGLEVWLVGLARNGRSFLDANFPSARQFDHLVLWLPQQGNLPAQYVDPSCEGCAPGTLPGWSRGAKGVRFRALPTLGLPVVEAEWAVAEGAAAPASLFRLAMEAKVAPSGDVQVAAREEVQGSDAEELARWLREAKAPQVRQRALGRARAASGAARLDRHARPQCEPSGGPCRWEYAFALPQAALPGGEVLVVPLTAFSEDYTSSHRLREREREVAVVEPWTGEESLVLEVPAGWRVAELPAAASHRSPLGEARVEVKAEEGRVTVVRRLTRRPGRHTSAAWGTFQKALRLFDSVRDEVVVLERVQQASAAP